MLKTQVTKLEPNKVALVVEVEKERVVEAYANFFQRAARAVKIPGFRPGKAPKNVIASRIGNDAIKSQIIEELVGKTYPQALKEAKLEPISPFRLEESNLVEGEPFTFKCVMEIMPKILDFNYNGFEVKIKKAIVDDESVQKVLGQLREQFSKTVPLEAGELQINDFFLANIQASCGGQPEPELTDEKSYHKLAEGNKMLAPLTGAKVGETRAFQYSFQGESEKNSKFYGKAIDFRVTIERISRPVAPELNDDFAKDVGDYKNLAELKEKIRANLVEGSEDDAANRAFDKLVQMIAENVTLVVPESMIQQTTDLFIQSMERRWRQMGTSLKEVLKKSNKDIKEIRESLREKATFQTKITLIVNAIGDREKIEVTDADYQAAIERQAQSQNIPVEKFLSSIKESTKIDIRSSIKNRKIREFLLMNNNVRYDMVSDADLNKGETQGDSGSDSN